MIESVQLPIVDASVHPAFAQPDDIRKYLPPEWSINLVLPAPWRFSYANPVGEFKPDFRLPGAWAGSDTGLLCRHVLDDPGASAAVLTPLGRGLVPDPEFQAAVVSAINRWLATEWLDVDNRLLGSVRVNPEDPVSAVAEIERWADHRQVVQVVVPLQSHRPYGDRTFLPVWRAAAAAGFPVVVRAEIAAGIEFWPTVLGYPEKFIDYAVLYPAAGLFHMTSLISEGTFDQVDNLIFVFGDGAFDLYLPFLWRMDKDYRPFKLELAWVKHMPSEYLNDHIRFLTRSAVEGPRDASALTEFIDIWGGERLLIFGSEYPHWDYVSPVGAYSSLPTRARAAILSDNAHRLYRARLSAGLDLSGA